MRELTRTARVDTSILGHAIPKGTIVIASAGFQHTDEHSHNGKRRVGYWEAGTTRQFIPERWLRLDGTFDANAGPSLPFSSGPRGCSGQKLAVGFHSNRADGTAPRDENDHCCTQHHFFLCTARRTIQQPGSVRNVDLAPRSVFRQSCQVVARQRASALRDLGCERCMICRSALTG